MRAALCTLLLVGLCGASPAAAQGGRYEGPWSVEITTQTGACGGPYKVLISVTDGILRLGNPDPSAMELGKVGASGIISGTLRRGGLEVSVKGQLFNAAGTGQWTLIREGGACAGRWIAEKVGSRL